MPVGRLRQAVDVLVELPAEPRLSDPRDPGHGYELRPPLLGAGVEEVLDLAELALAADERRLEPLRLELAAHSRDDPQGPPERHLAVLALQLEPSRVLVDDRALGRPPRRLAHEHRARLGDRLCPGRRVDQITGNHPLAARADGHGRLAGQHASARAQLRSADFVPQRGDRRDELERCAYGPLRVVLGRHRRAPDRHHRIADELLDRAAVQQHEAPARVEVAGEQLADLLCVPRLGERREPDQVCEQDGDEASLGERRLDARRRRNRSFRCGSLPELRAAVAAEPLPGRILGAARAAGGRERTAAVAAEPLVGGVLRAAVATSCHA